MDHVKKYQTAIYVFLFLLFSMSVFIPYIHEAHYQNIASNGDYTYVLDAKVSFMKNAYVFRPIMGNGYVDTSPWLLALYSPFLLFFLLFGSLQVSPLMITLLLIATALFLSCMFMYDFLLFFLVRRVHLNNKYVKFVSFVGAVVYGFTPYYTRLFEPGHFFFLYLSSFIPLVLKHFDLFLESDAINPKHLMIIFLAVLAHSFCFANIGYIFVYCLVLLLYAVTTVLVYNRSLFSTFIRVSLCCTTVVLANIWWLLPMAVTMENVSALNEQSKKTIGAGIFGATQNANILNIVSGRAEAILPLSSKMNTLFFEYGMTAFYLFILLFAVLFLVRSHDKKYHFFAFVALALVTIYIIKGPQQPFPQLFMYLYDHVLGFQIFRRPVSKIYWFYFFAFTTAGAAGIAHFLGSIRNISAKALIVAILITGLLFFVSIYGLSKELIPFNIPQNYYNASAKLESDCATKVLLLPDLGGLFPHYNKSLNYLAGLDFLGQVWELKQYIPNETPWTLDTPERQKVNTFARNIYTGENICSLAKELNVSHIIVRHDLLPKNYNTDLLRAAQVQLEKNKDIKYRKVYQDSFTLFGLVQECRSFLISLSNTNINLQKVNPVKFKVGIHGLKNPQTLTYLEAFNRDWKLYLTVPRETGEKRDQISTVSSPLMGKSGERESDQTFFEGEELAYLWKKPFAEETHQTAFTYANSWTIDPLAVRENYEEKYYRTNADGSMDIELILYYKPQSYFYLGLVITFSILMGFAVAFLYHWREKLSVQSWIRSQDD